MHNVYHVYGRMMTSGYAYDIYDYSHRHLDTLTDLKDLFYFMQSNSGRYELHPESVNA